MATKVIPVTAADVPSTQTNVVLLLQPSEMTGWTTLTQGEADSIRIYTDAGLTTEIPRDVRNLDKIFIRVPSVTSSLTLYADYDGARSDHAASATNGRNAVYSDYLAVYPLGGVTDVTGNGHDLTAFGSPADTTDWLGISAEASAYTGSTSVYHKYTAGLIGNNDGLDYTIQSFVLPDASARYNYLGQYPDIYMAWDHPSFGDDFVMFTLCPSGNGEAGSTDDLSTGAWYLVHGTRVGANKDVGLFVDGVSKATGSGVGDNNIASSSAFTVGTVDVNGSNSGVMDGKIAEVRLRQDILPADHIAIEGNNYTDVAGFWGTVTDAPTSSAPTVTTQAVSAVAETTATGNGNVTADGGETITERGVCWDTSTGPTTSDSKATAAGTTGAFTASITGLTGSTTYYVRAYAVNSEGTSYGSEVQFNSAAGDVAPTATTQAVTSITGTTAVGNGNITSDGGATISERGIVWDTATGPTTSDSKVVVAGTTGAFTGSITGLTASTLYYVRAYATNAEGTSYGAEVTFTTTIALETYNVLKYYNGTEWVRAS